MATVRQHTGMIVSALVVGSAASVGFLLSGLPILLLVMAIALIALTFVSPEAVALLGISVLYLNLPGIAVTVHHLPSVVAASALLLLVAPLLVRILLGGEAVLVDRPLLLIVAFLGAVLLSLFAVQDQAAASAWLVTFLVEGLLLYFLVLNLFRTLASLRRALDVLMLCCALLGGLTLYQEVTHSYAHQFGGLAQRNLERDDVSLEKKDPFRDPNKIVLSNRSGGPVGGANRYAQILIVLLPLVYFRMRTHRTLPFRLFCAACGALILAGALLTYSRGGFVGLVALLAMLTWMRGIRLREVGLFAGLAALAVVVMAPGFILRVQTLQGVSGIAQESQRAESDEVILGRLTEMMAAFNVFLDHPVVGVGPGQYLPVYSQTYMNDPDIALRHITVERRAHTLYFELAAETGILGIVTFFAVVVLIQVRLWRTWRRWRGRRPDLAGLAGGFFLAIVGYLVTAVFLQLAYQRYYWLLLGLAGAALQILDQESKRFGQGPAEA
jgi:hypothetical protein